MSSDLAENDDDAELLPDKEFVSPDDDDIKAFFARMQDHDTSAENYNPNKFDKEAQLVFLEEFASHANKSTAAKCANVSLGLIDYALDKSPRFRKLYEYAEQIAADKIDEEMHRRAIEGYERAVYQDGEKVGTIKKYSDRLLERLAEAHKPDKYTQDSDTDVDINITWEGSAPDNDEKEVVPADSNDDTKDGWDTVPTTETTGVYSQQFKSL